MAETVLVKRDLAAGDFLSAPALDEAATAK
jgi:hypothetical protein